MAFLLELLKSSVAMQEQMLGGKGFLVIGYLLEKVCKSLHKILPLFSNLTCVTTPVKIRSTIKVFWNQSIKNKVEKFRQFCLQVHLLVRAGTAFIKARFRLDASLISHISTRHRFHKSQFLSYLLNVLHQISQHGTVQFIVQSHPGNTFTVHKSCECSKKNPKTCQLCYKLSRHAHEDGPEREMIRLQAVLIGCLFFFCLFSCMNNTGTFWPNFTIEPVRLYKLIKQQHLPHSHHTTEHRAFAPLLTDHKTQYHCKHSLMLLYICTVQLLIKFSLSKCAYFTFLCIQYMHLIKFVIVLLFLY